MKYILVIALGLLATATLCSSQCSRLSQDKEKTGEGCIDEKDVHHQLGSSWMSKCFKCTCYEEYINCCNTAVIPTGYDDDCETILNEKTCTYSVVKKNDHSKTCPYSGAILK
ncbi:beta-microseminoprotein [Protopterus annectens]|uniref:beta-microseminoprotein n=1 Tax=Protopterus annectens TaxID=7888 RepID=UPI001CFBC618|nr:beta-microseminoprotein [Protopterus annectens]